jgi:hypothetical protein
MFKRVFSMLDSMDPREFENKLSKEELRKRVKDLRLRTKLTEPEELQEFQFRDFKLPHGDKYQYFQEDFETNGFYLGKIDKDEITKIMLESSANIDTLLTAGRIEECKVNKERYLYSDTFITSQNEDLHRSFNAISSMVFYIIMKLFLFLIVINCC